MQLITRRDIIKLMGKVLAVAGVGVAAPSLLLAETVKPELEAPILNTKGIDIETLKYNGPGPIYTSGYMQAEPFNHGTVAVMTTTDATQTDKWIRVNPGLWNPEGPPNQWL